MSQPKATFLSYASQDADAARRICEALRAAGLEVWFDQNELRGGDAWDASIRKQIKECALFVPIISNNTNAREEGYFRLEWKLAVDRSHLMADHKAFLFPVILGDVAEASAFVPDRFRERQWTRLNDDVSIKAFAERIAKLATAKTVAPTQIGAPVPSSVQGQATLGPDVHRDDNSKTGASREQLSPSNATPSIAVLAFANRSASADDEYFSDGLADELLSVLAKIKGLRVAARSSAFSFKGKSDDIATIGQKLNVATVLEGSVRKSGNRARISVQLIKVNDGFQLWSETYDRTLDDIFAVQDDIAQAVVTQLRSALLNKADAASDPTDIAKEIADANAYRGHNAEVQRLMLEARFQIQLRTTEGIARGIGLCEQALVLEYGNANAHAQLAFARQYVAFYTQAQRGDRSTAIRSMRLAKEHADLAISINPTLAYPYMARGSVSWLMEHDAAARIKDEEIGLSLAPDDPEILRLGASSARLFGRFDEAHALLERAKALEPQSMLLKINAGLQLHFTRQFDKSVEFMQQLFQEIPDRDWATYQLGLTAWCAGQHGLAVEMLVQNAELRGDAEAAAHLRQRYAGQGWHHFLRGIADGKANLQYATYLAAAARATLGDFDGAFAALEECIASQHQSIGWVKFDPVLDPLRGDPRYPDLIRRIGFPE